jgi:hypothetical protein
MPMLDLGGPTVILLHGGGLDDAQLSHGPCTSRGAERATEIMSTCLISAAPGPSPRATPPGSASSELDRCPSLRAVMLSDRLFQGGAGAAARPPAGTALRAFQWRGSAPRTALGTEPATLSCPVLVLSRETQPGQPRRSPHRSSHDPGRCHHLVWHRALVSRNASEFGAGHLLDPISTRE